MSTGHPPAASAELTTTSGRGVAADPGPDNSEVPWQRLDIRVVWVDAVIFLLSLLPSFVTTVVLGLDFSSGSFGIWPAVVATTVGVVGSVGDLLRWLKTWYRVTDDRVEQRTGLLTRKYRFVPRDRIRSVDTTARLRHRVAALRVVHIGSGDARPSFRLDAVSRKTAGQLRHDLLRRHPAGAIDPPGGARPAAGPPTEQETVLARLRWSWIFYNLINIWAFLLAVFLLWSSYWILQLVTIDLGELIRRMIDWEALGPVWSVVVGVGGTFLLGVVGLAVGFVKDNWDFQLVRVSTDRGTALLTRQGLLQTREVYREDRRVRGMHISEPLFWRWIGLAETEVISTGLSGWSPGSEPASSILPRTPITEARRVAALVLPDGVRPLEAPLRAHPRTALYRRLLWAVVVPASVAGLLVWLGATDVVPRWVWVVPIGLLPVTWVLAAIAYRSLGHTLVGPYLVVRWGLSRRETVVLERRAVIGWTLRQSLVQRWLGLVTVGIATAGGSRFYQVPDIGADHAVVLVDVATPKLVDDFIDRIGGSSSRSVASGRIRTDVLRGASSVRDDLSELLDPERMGHAVYAPANTED